MDLFFAVGIGFFILPENFGFCGFCSFVSSQMIHYILSFDIVLLNSRKYFQISNQESIHMYKRGEKGESSYFVFQYQIAQLAEAKCYV